MSLQAEEWTLDKIRQHILENLPISAHLGLHIDLVTQERCELTISESPGALRPGGSVAGPVIFGAADVGSYALILATRGDPAAVTVDQTTHFHRPAMSLPLLAHTLPVRIGRRLATTETRLFEKQAPSRVLASAISTWAFP